MAFDTVVDKAFLENGLTAIADEIRACGAAQEPCWFPDGFVSAISDMCGQKDTLLKAVIERTVREICNTDVVRVAPCSFMKCTNLTSANFPNAASVGAEAFRECTALASVNVPSATIIGNNAFKECAALAELSLPKVWEIRANAFDECAGLTDISLPVAETLGQYAFAACTSLKTLDLPKAESIADHAFRKAANLETLILRNPSGVCALGGTGVFYGIESITVYVPGALISAYQTADNWSVLADAGTCVFAAIEGSEYEG